MMQSLSLVAAIGVFILLALAVSLWIGRKVPTVRDLLQRELDAYKVRELEQETDIANTRHSLNATREHIRRLSARLAKPDAVEIEAKVLHIVGRQAK
jgi:hypothetical protein